MKEKPAVLLVDDDQEVVRGLAQCLSRAGFWVVTCEDGDEAIAALEGLPFDMVVSDIQMPRLNGLALLDWVQQNRPAVRFVAMTAFGSALMYQRAMGKGAAMYLQKPVDPQLLIDVLRKSNPRTSFHGNVDEVELFDYVQLLLFTRRRALLEVVSPHGESGLIYFDEGTVSHAVCGELEGEAAFFHLLSLDGGAFNSQPWRDPVRATIQRPGDFLLLEAARLKDEKQPGISNGAESATSAESALAAVSTLGDPEIRVKE